MNRICLVTGLVLVLAATACSPPAPLYPTGDAHPASAGAPVAQMIVNPDALLDQPADAGESEPDRSEVSDGMRCGGSMKRGGKSHPPGRAGRPGRGAHEGHGGQTE
jgi:hypothetical protein